MCILQKLIFLGIPKKLTFFGRFSGPVRVRISNVNLAKVDIFGNAKKVSAEIMISNHEESIVCVRISNRI